MGLASGLSIRTWSQRHGVPTPTAHAWARTVPGFKAKEEARRRRATAAVVKRPTRGPTDAPATPAKSA